MAEFDFEAFQRLVLEKFADLGEELRAVRSDVHIVREQVRQFDRKADELGQRIDRVHTDLAALTGSVGSLVTLAGGHRSDILELSRRVDALERQRREGE